MKMRLGWLTFGVPSTCDDMQNSSPLIILGMHRSGTSALAGLLQRLGVEFGNKLLPAMQGVNDKGFYENVDAVEVHEELLCHLGYRWFDVRQLPACWWLDEDVLPFRSKLTHIVRRDFMGSRLWGIKDPRMCRLMPIWNDVLQALKCEPKFILIYRKPSEVVESLRRRDGLDETGAYITWLWHALEAERWSRGRNRVIVTYEQLLTDWRGTLDRVADSLGIAWPINFSDAEENIEDFLDIGLRHCRAERAFVDSGFSAQSDALFDLVKDGSTASFDVMFASFLLEIETLSPCLGYLNQVQDLRAQNTHALNALRAEKKNASEQIQYRDALVTELQRQLDAEKQNGMALTTTLHYQLDIERKYAIEQIECRDALVAELQARVDALDRFIRPGKNLLKLFSHVFGNKRP